MAIVSPTQKNRSPRGEMPTGFTMQPDSPSSAISSPGSSSRRTLTRGDISHKNLKQRTESIACNRDILKAPRLKECGPMRPNEVQSLISHATRLLQEFPLVHNLDAPVRTKIPELLGYIRAPAGTVLFEEDDAPDMCYITLTGEVAVVKENFTGDMFNFGDGTPAARKHCVAIARSLAKPVTQNPKYVPATHCPDQAESSLQQSLQHSDTLIESFGTPMAILGAGTMFGERGLIEDTPRDATVVTKVMSEFLIIERDDFDNVLKQEIKKAQVKQFANVTQQLLADVPFFMKLSPAVQNKVPDLVHHLRREAGAVMFREGDPPDLCYIVLAGEVSVWKKMPSEGSVESQDKSRRQSAMVRKTLGSAQLQERCQALIEGLTEGLDGSPDDAPLAYPRHSRQTIVDTRNTVILEEPGEHPHHRSSRHTSRRSTVSSMLGHREDGLSVEGARSSVSVEAVEDAEHDSDEEVEEHYTSSESDVYGSLVSLLGPGSLFGELALLEDQPRNATVVCRTNADFLIIERADFERTLKEEMMKGMSQDLPKFVQPLLSDFPFFQKLDERVVQCVPGIMTLHSEIAGSVLFWEGDPPGRCYIILSGIVAVWKTESQQTEALLPDEIAVTSKDLRKKCASLVSKFFPEACLHDEKVGSPDHEEGRMSGPKTSFLSAPVDEAMGSKVAYLGTGMLFGESALIEEKPRNATVTCEQDCYFLAIEKTDFDNVLATEMRKARVRQLGAQVLRVLREFEVFWQLEFQVQEQLPEIVRYASSPSGTLLFEQGSPPTFCYVILSGEVTVWKRKLPRRERDDQDHHREEPPKSQSPPAKKSQGGSGQIHHARPWGAGPHSHHGSHDHQGHHGHHAHDHHGHGHHGHDDHSPHAHARSSGGSQAHPDHNARASKDANGQKPPNSPLGHETGTIRKSFRMPPLVMVSNAVRARCLALAAMLAESAAKDAKAPCMPAVHGVAAGARDEECIGMVAHGEPVAALGPGIIFGELALLSDHPRDATVTCREDCEFLVIDKIDFDRSIKSAMKKANNEKLDFLRKHAPMMKYIGESTAESILRFFEKVSYPRNHRFLKLGQQTDGSIYFVWKGSVECQARAPESAESARSPRSPRTTPNIRGRSQKREELQKCGVLLRGSIFGAVVPKVASALSIVAVSSPCEVLRISPESVKQLPDSVVQGLRELIDRDMQRRMGHRIENNALNELMGGNATVRPATSYLRQSRGFMQLPPGADLPKALHLGKVVGAAAWTSTNTPRCRLPAVTHTVSLKAKEAPKPQPPPESRRRALRSYHDHDGSDSRRTSRSQSRASSRSPSRRQSQVSLPGARSRSHSKSQSRTDLLQELVTSPFVHINEKDSRLISMAGKHPRYELMFDMRGVSPTSTRASTPKRPNTSLSTR
mmetsp:Transcript_140508/g.243334  ORF Transcript_140508/g.243334 Transcript_140508/m.243334 type:complete len:1392 (+) Transcript_140508:175-4350(+)